MPFPRFLGSLVTLAVIFVGLSGVVPRRPFSTQVLPLPFAASLPSEARPALGEPVVAPVSFPLAQPSGDALESDEVTVAPIVSSLFTLPAINLERFPADATTLRDIAKAIEVDPAMLATFNGLALETADEALNSPALSVPSGLVAVPSLKLRADPPPPQSLSYVISAGDTLYGIALRFGVDPQTLAAANGLANPDFIHPGDQLAVSLWSTPAAPLPRANPVSATSNAPLAGASVAAIAQSAAAETAPAVTPARPTTPVTYAVEEGDTVSVIAERFGVDTETIVSSNALASADRIRAGDELTILPISGVMHTVRAGQTLSEIAALYRVDLGPIIDFNYLDDADLITVGKDLLIPGARPLPPPTARAQTTYQVAPGDTLSSIAVRFGVSSGSISGANGLLNPDRLSVGAQLTIPGASGATQAAQQIVTRNLPVFTPSAAANLPFSTGGGGDTLASYAMRFLGARYVFGGTGPSGFDCSGFVYYVQANAGKSVSRGMWGQYNAGAHPSRSQLQPGDLVFFQNTYMPGLSHNGIYIGGGQFINAVDERSGVKISNMNDAYWSSRWFGATRVW